MEIKNALIDEVQLGIEDHGILVAWLMLDYGDSSHQGFGGYSLDKPGKDGRTGSEFGTTFILQCLKICGVDSWEKIKGKNIRVKSEDGLAKEIGHITKNIWFNPRELALSLGV